ncbi:MAG TPA: ATP-binding protein [Pseudonocardiaceae bacterium]|nr:ATP-binding protein [Pseudonocardiaceae bacterium]
MSSDTPLIASLRGAVAATPDDVPLRLHLAELLLGIGAVDDAITHVAAALQRDPASAQARELMARAVSGAQPGRPAAGPAPAPQAAPSVPQAPAAPPAVSAPASSTEEPQAPEPAPRSNPAPQPSGFDWASAERELSDLVPPRFVDEDAEDPGETLAFDIESSNVRLADVAGMTEVKKRLQAAFLAPMNNPELRKLYGKSLRGGLLLYGPPGCGKTFIARAVAGELGAKFISIGLNDVLEMWIGSSERNLHEVFAAARRAAPCVVFLDEIDALGHKRSQLRNSAMRGAVNQLLTELDGVTEANDGVFVLAATNHPWDVDGALRRPGRFDRTLLVLPPDETAREGVLRYHLRDRPIARIDTKALAKRTHGYSGADLAHICETAAERALMDSVATGHTRMIEMADLLAALGEIRPSIGAWLNTARNVVEFSNVDGTYDELRGYLKKERLL